jgi:ATPase subunit of ABC transporter with duplicated ATPase domains
MAALSGGQAARVSMAALLLSRYDVFLLDEPTNDLDLAGLARLEEFVPSVGRTRGVVLVSHDREFLARTVTRILELDLAQDQVNHYGGGYASYLEERAVARAHARASYEEYAGTRARLMQRARTQRAWADKGVRNARRKATDNDKNVRHFRAESSEKQAGKVRATERLMERLEVVDEPRKEWELRMTIAAAPRAGAIVASLQDAVVRRGTFTLGPMSLRIDWAERVGIVGANGSGKSTLLAALLGRIPLDAGTATLGPGVVVGEVDQARAYLGGAGEPGIGRLDKTGRAEPLVDTFRSALASRAGRGPRPELTPAEARTLLAKFGLGAEHVLRASATLSPGERTRAALALLQARGVNLLVLDEPTNHLDLPAIEQLESALASYPGTLVLVTHDRRMLDSVRLTRMITVGDGMCEETPIG